MNRGGARARRRGDWSFRRGTLAVVRIDGLRRFETLFSATAVAPSARRLSSDWESTRLKIELSPVQIGEAAYSVAANDVSSHSKSVDTI